MPPHQAPCPLSMLRRTSKELTHRSPQLNEFCDVLMLHASPWARSSHRLRLPADQICICDGHMRLADVCACLSEARARSGDSCLETFGLRTRMSREHSDGGLQRMACLALQRLEALLEVQAAPETAAPDCARWELLGGPGDGNPRCTRM